MNKREQMKRAIDDAKKSRPKVAAAATPPPAKVAAAASGGGQNDGGKTESKKPGKPKRSARARDARAKARGRLPSHTQVIAWWDGNRWVGSILLFTEATAEKQAEQVRVFKHTSDGLFRLMEELDVMFWEWFTAPGDEEIKALLVFNPDAPDPEKS